jgi:hypothetical protein
MYIKQGVLGAVVCRLSCKGLTQGHCMAGITCGQTCHQSPAQYVVYILHNSLHTLNYKNHTIWCMHADSIHLLCFLQDAMSSSTPSTDEPSSPTRYSPTGNSSNSPTWSSPSKRSPDKRSCLQRSSSAYHGNDASPAAPSSPSCKILSPSKLFSRALPFPVNTTTSTGNRISDGANDSSTSADNDSTPAQPLRSMLAASIAASKQQKQQQQQQRAASLPSSPQASPSPSSYMRGTFAPSPTTSPARGTTGALPSFVPASPARAEPLPADLQDNILHLVSLLSSTDTSTSALTAQQLAVLAFTSAANPGPIIAAGAVEPLAKMLRGAASDEQQEGAAAALWGLARGSSAHQAIIIDSNAVLRYACLQEQPIHAVVACTA